jgi:hypothetical protein
VDHCWATLQSQDIKGDWYSKFIARSMNFWFEMSPICTM